MDQITISREDFHKRMLAVIEKPDGIVQKLSNEGGAGGAYLA